MVCLCATQDKCQTDKYIARALSQQKDNNLRPTGIRHAHALSLSASRLHHEWRCAAAATTSAVIVACCRCDVKYRIIIMRRKIFVYLYYFSYKIFVCCHFAVVVVVVRCVRMLACLRFISAHTNKEGETRSP